MQVSSPDHFPRWGWALLYFCMIMKVRNKKKCLEVCPWSSRKWLQAGHVPTAKETCNAASGVCVLPTATAYFSDFPGFPALGSPDVAQGLLWLLNLYWSCEILRCPSKTPSMCLSQLELMCMGLQLEIVPYSIPLYIILKKTVGSVHQSLEQRLSNQMFFHLVQNLRLLHSP